MAKNTYRFWRIRKAIAIFALIVSALTTNSFNTATIFFWVVGVAAPIGILFLTSNDGDEMEHYRELLQRPWRDLMGGGK